MADRGPDRLNVRNVGEHRPQDPHPTDVGRTMGGGSLGHAPASDVAHEADLRNNAPDDHADAEQRRQNQPARPRDAQGHPTGTDEDARDRNGGPSIKPRM